MYFNIFVLASFCIFLAISILVLIAACVVKACKVFLTCWWVSFQKKKITRSGHYFFRSVRCWKKSITAPVNRLESGVTGEAPAPPPAQVDTAPAQAPAREPASAIPRLEHVSVAPAQRESRSPPTYQELLQSEEKPPSYQEAIERQN